MTQEEYMAAIGRHLDTPVKDFLQHGGEWKKHKYIRIENGRYIYPEDDKAKEKLTEKARANIEYEQAKGAKKTLEEINRSEKKSIKNDPNNQATQNARREKETFLGKEVKHAAVDDYKNRKLEHATKWKSHKNLKLIGDRYVYEDEEARARSDEAQDAGKKRTEAMKAGLKKAATEAGNKAQESGKARTESLKKGMAENAIKKYQEDGMKRTAKEQAGKEKLAKSASSVRAGDHSAEDAEEKMKGFDLWRKRQAQMKSNARIKHANEPMSRDEFYAAVNDYKQKH